MIQEKKDFCFCTFASGSTYRSLAKNLVSDIEKYAPGTFLILFTDQPSEFSNYKNVLVVKHKRQGILCYHERRFAIAKALSMFNSCMYLDADVRICSPVSEEILAKEWLPGITAKSCTSMIKHIQTRIHKTNPPRQDLIKDFEFYQKMARKLGLDIEGDKVVWINEFLFVVTRDSGKEIEFLKYWDKLALYAELNGHHKHPAYAIGLAATKVGFPIRWDAMPGLDYFDDRVEAWKIAKGKSDKNAKLSYFETQEKIEKSKRSILQKVMMKLGERIEYYYHSSRLRLTTLRSDYDFYYRQGESRSE